MVIVRPRRLGVHCSRSGQCRQWGLKLALPPPAAEGRIVTV
jgi:hypothetical protein